MNDATMTPGQRLLQTTAWSDVRGVAFAVLGLGRSGIAAANVLARRGADVQAYDDRNESQLEAAVAKLDKRVRWRAGGGYIARPAEICVLSPGIAPHTALYRRADATAGALIGEVELFFRLDRADDGGHRLIAISGTDGKTTTAMMIAHLLQTNGDDVCLAGNIGTPLCEVLDELEATTWVVAEVSAFQLATCVRFRPDIAVLTNVAGDHDDWFSGDRDAYAAAKRAVARCCGTGDRVIFNADDRAFSMIDEQSPAARHIGFSVRASREDGFFYRDSTLRFATGGRVIDLLASAQLGADTGNPLPGLHNVANALAASAAAFSSGLSFAAIEAGLRSFVPAPHRLQAVGTIADVRFIDDSKATNPHAAIAGLRATVCGDEDKLVWIAGGSEKDADFSELAAEVGERVHAAVLIGASRERLAAALPSTVSTCLRDSMHDAVAEAWSLAGPKGVVLLSPACASFGLFRSYAHRGDVFIEAVQQLRAAVEK